MKFIIRSFTFLFLLLFGVASLLGKTSISGGISQNVVTDFPYYESFENGLGEWNEQISTNIWRRYSGNTPSGSTGPAAAIAGDYYMYTEASSPNYPNITAVLEGPSFDLSQSGTAFFDFQYHMYGSTMGALKLEISTNGGGSWTTLWTKSGDQDIAWHPESVNLSSYAGQVIQLRFYAQTGSSFSSDMAIDDLSLYTLPAISTSTCNTTISSFPYNEGFETGFGLWSEVYTSNGADIWSRTSGSTPSGGTGPSGAYAGSFYLYTEASSGNSNRQAILEGPCFDLTQASLASLTFRYNFNGEDMGALHLELSTDEGASWIRVWSKGGDLGDLWLPGGVDLSGYAGEVVQLRFFAETGPGYQSDMAIDDLRLTLAPLDDGSGGCSNIVSAFPYQEGFESGLRLWTEQISTGIWTRNSGFTGSTDTGPMAAYEGSYYMYTEASSPNYPNKIAVLEGPCFDLSTALHASFTFRYHMYGSDMGSLSLEVSEDGGGNWATLWNRAGSQGLDWQQGFADLSAYAGKTVQLRFYGVTGPGFRSDMAVDALYLGITTEQSPGALAGQVLFPLTETCSDAQYSLCCGEDVTGDLIPGVPVMVENLTSSSSMTEYTDGSGTFTAAIGGGLIKISPQVPNDSWINGVSTLDVIDLSKHYSGQEYIGCPLRRLVGDVDNDGDIDQMDEDTLIALINGNITSLSNAPNWRFVSRAYTLPIAVHPDERFAIDFWDAGPLDEQGNMLPFSAQLRFGGKQMDYGSADSWVETMDQAAFDPSTACEGEGWGFWMIKMGDVNGTADHSGFLAPPGGGGGQTSLAAVEKEVILPRATDRTSGFAGRSAGVNWYEVRFIARTPEQVEGYQLDVEFDDEVLELGMIKPNKDYLNLSGEKNFGQARKTVRGGSIRTVWVNDFQSNPEGLSMAGGVTQESTMFLPGYPPGNWMIRLNLLKAKAPIHGPPINI